MNSIPPPAPKVEEVAIVKKKIAKKPPPETHDYKSCEEHTNKFKKLHNRNFHTTIESQKNFKAKKELKIVHISDTHLKMESYLKHIEKCDILLHTGDFTNAGGLKELKEFNEALGKCKQAKHKIIIAGNHDFYEDMTVSEIQNVLTNGIYLFESSITIEGVKIWGSPWVPFNQMAWEPKQDTKVLWKKAPEDCDILMTHCPPNLILDLAYDPERKTNEPCDQCGLSHIRRDHWGCFNLIDEIFGRIKPVVHCFGHVHEYYGSINWNGVCFINGATKPMSFTYKIFDKETTIKFQEVREKSLAKFVPRDKLKHQQVQFKKVLDFSNKKLNDTELWYWIEAILISRNNYCEELILSNNNITDDGVCFIGVLIEKTKLIVKLDLSGNTFQDYNPLLEAVRKNLTLRELILPGDAPTDILKEVSQMMKRNHKFIQ